MKIVSRFWTAISLSVSILGAIASNAIAADRVILSYPPFERSIAVEDLETFVETGETTTTLDQLFDNTALTPTALTIALTREVNATPQFLDRHLNSLPGKLVLSQVGRTIRTPSGDTNARALRSAMVLAASDDEQFSALEVIEHYPTEEVYVELRGMVRAFRRIENVIEDVADALP